MIKFAKYFILIILFSLSNWKLLVAQDSLKFLDYPSKTQLPRLYLVSGSISTAYTGAMLLLNQYWYAGFPKSPFHFFDDSQEWLQIDKAGHLLNAYYLSNWSRGLFQWTGIAPKQAAWIGFGSSMLFMSSIEIFDGFSSKWGASWTDLATNFLGSSISLTQDLSWHQQRIRVKLSVTPHQYPPDLQQRIQALYGDSFAELILKDYNATNVWLSINPSMFMSKTNPYPKYLSWSIGYGAEGLLGGRENKWIDPQNGLIVDRSDIPRYRQFFLAPDIDLSRIPVKKIWLHKLLNVLNIIKIPAPTLELNPQDGLRWHWIYF